MGKLLNLISEKAREGRKQLAVLVDPDKTNSDASISTLLAKANAAEVDFLMVGGSLMLGDQFDDCIARLKSEANMPVIIFPGSPLQVSAEADGILFLSLISGRNPEALIGHHVMAAPYVRKAGLEVLPTGYMLIESGRATTASYMSNTTPIPHDKPEIAACTALAGEMLGLQLIYMDGGSGARNTITPEMISAVRKTVDIPLIVGGGIRSAEAGAALASAGADLLVIGNGTEDNPELITSLSEKLRAL